MRQKFTKFFNLFSTWCYFDNIISELPRVLVEGSKSERANSDRLEGAPRIRDTDLGNRGKTTGLEEPPPVCRDRIDQNFNRLTPSRWPADFFIKKAIFALDLQAIGGEPVILLFVWREGGKIDGAGKQVGNDEDSTSYNNYVCDFHYGFFV